MNYRISKNIIIEVFENNELVALDTHTETTYLLNETAAFILRCFQDKDCSLENAKNMFIQKY